MQSLANGLSNKELGFYGTGSTVAMTVKSGSPYPTAQESDQLLIKSTELGSYLATHGIGVLSIMEIGQLMGYMAASFLVIKVIYKQILSPAFNKAVLIYRWIKSLFG